MKGCVIDFCLHVHHCYEHRNDSRYAHIRSCELLPRVSLVVFPYSSHTDEGRILGSFEGAITIVRPELATFGFAVDRVDKDDTRGSQRVSIATQPDRILPIVLLAHEGNVDIRVLLVNRIYGEFLGKKP